MTSVDDSKLEVGQRKDHAAGAPAVAVAMERAIGQMGVLRTARTLLRLNQADGFDCQGCAWPDPDPSQRHTAEFCENGAKHVADEATRTRCTPEFFAAHSITELYTKSEHWLGQQGRLTHPMVKRPGADHYTLIGWDEVFTLIGEQLNALGGPDEAVFYTSGRTSNEAAFLYQLFARAYGTNNMPDCSNMCHESTSVALAETIGIGKGTVSLQDVYDAELIVIAGQNPGTNHPRMLSALERAKQNGARILAINPLVEAGLLNFKNPQTPKGMLTGIDLADEYLRIKLNGDLALFQAIGLLLLEAEDRAAAEGVPGAVADQEFIAERTTGYAEYAAHLRALDWDTVYEATGLSRDEIEAAAAMFVRSRKTVLCWSMGITQHRNAVATIKEIVNVALLQGNIGKPGAGLCPVRGHSNVQGDRTMGIWEKPPSHFLDRLRDEFGFEPPREHGYDTVQAIRALRDGEAKVFIGMGGNFAAATPDTKVTEAALRNAALTVQISTKLNRSHVVCGETALILPVLGRTERDVQASGEQFVSVEDSMASVHSSRGRLEPASEHLISEVALVSRLARATLDDRTTIPWADFEADYGTVRERIARVVPGCEGYPEKVVRREGFVLPRAPHDTRSFETPDGRAPFTVSPLDVLRVPAGRLILQTLRSHDQFNTTVYALDDRYRGIKGGREVIFVHPDDLTELGFRDGETVDIVSEWTDGSERCIRGFRIVSYDTARGSAAAYYPEANVLVPLDSTVDGSNTPTSKSVVIRLERPGATTNGGGRGRSSADDIKSTVEPYHLS
jgi:molybdopterin-dependent oxidoreductase alpha subunit